MTAKSASSSDERFYTETVMIRIIEGVLKLDQRFAVTLKTCQSLIECEWSAFMAFANRANRLSELFSIPSFNRNPCDGRLADGGLITKSSSEGGFPSHDFSELERQVESDFWLVDRLKTLAMDYEKSFGKPGNNAASLLDDFVCRAIHSLLNIIERHCRKETTMNDASDVNNPNFGELPDFLKKKSNEQRERPSASPESSPSHEFDLASWLDSSNRKSGFRQTLSFNGVEVGFVWISAGEFDMGTPTEIEDKRDRDEDETLHHVRISRGFWMLETPVTQQLYKAVAGDDDSQFKGDDLPCDRLSYDDACAFCKEIQKATPKGLIARLPTEAEWEYACRAGTQTAFSFGDLPCPIGFLIDVFVGRNADNQRDKDNIHVAHCLFCRMNHEEYFKQKTEKNQCLLCFLNAWPSFHNTTGVKEYPPNQWGLYDMHGNINEWTSDWYGAYPEVSVVDPQGPNEGEGKVVRGGCYSNNLVDCRSAARGRRNCPTSERCDVGFRLVLAPAKDA